MSFLSFAARGVSKQISLIGHVLALVFGRLQWTAPGYLRWVGTRAAQAGRGLAARPKLSAGIFALMVAGSVGGWYGWQWWQARPKPVEVKFALTEPTRTEIENDKDNKPHPLVVKFTHGVAPIALVGKDVTQGIETTPPIAGTWHWETDRELEFRPKDDWPVGGEFRVALDRQAIAPQIRLAAWDFSFKAPAFIAKINKAEFYQDPANPTFKKVIVEIEFSHPIDPASLERRVDMHRAGSTGGVLGVGTSKTQFTVSYDKLKLKAYVHSENLPIPKDSTALEFVVDPGVASARGGKPTNEALKGSVAIPGLYSLSIVDVGATVVSNEQNDPEQVLVLGTSAGVHEKDFAGAVSVWELPLRHPAKKPGEDDRPYDWSDPAEVTQSILAGGRKVALDPIAAEMEYSGIHSFKYHADVGRYLFVQVEKGVKSFGGYLLPERELRIVRVPPFPSELRILSQGALLALSSEKKVAVLVRDLPGVRVEVGRVLPGQLQHLVSQASGRFDKPEFSGAFSADNLVERFERKIALPNLPRGRAHYEAVDLGEFLRQDGETKRGVFLLRVQGYEPKDDRAKAVDQAEPGQGDNPQAVSSANDVGGADGNDRGASAEDATHSDVPPAQRVDERLVLVTDLGILVKRELDGSQAVFVQSIHSGQPVADATVDVVGKNGVTIQSLSTDEQGLARFSKLDNLSRERAPLMYLVKKGGDLSFLPLNHNDRTLDLSRFDIGGIANARQADQLNAYLFSDRGIYRPGDTFHIGIIVKSAGWTRPNARSLVGLPIEAEVLDARGLTVKRERIKLAAGGFNELAHTTLDTSSTGTYTVNLYTVKDGRAHQQIGSTQVAVREFEPDRMKVSAHLSTEVSEGWISPDDLKARINVQNLFGTPAENRRVEATLTLAPAFPSFQSYPGYAFYDPLRAKEGYSDKLAEGKTNAQGDAEFDLKLGKYASATYRLHLLARVFEAEGGRSVAAEVASLVSARDYLIGVKRDGDLDYVSRGAKRRVSVIAIDRKAAKTVAPKLTLQFIERKFVSVLIKQDSGVYKYESRKKEVTLKKTPLAVPATGYGLDLATDTPGNFAYVIKDDTGVELNRVEYSVAGHGNVTRSLDRNAELQLTLDRKDYAPGDEIAISVRAPYTGAGLITIERDKVYAHGCFRISCV